MGRTVSSIHCKAHALGLQFTKRKPRACGSGRRWTDEERAKAVDMRRAGLPNRAIAAALNRTVMSVEMQLHKMGVHHRLDDEAVETAWRLAGTMPMKDVAASLGVTYEALRHRGITKRAAMAAKGADL